MLRPAGAYEVLGGLVAEGRNWLGPVPGEGLGHGAAPGQDAVDGLGNFSQAGLGGR